MATKSLFDYLEDVTLNKKQWCDEPDFLKGYSQFMMNRFISQQDLFLPLIESLNKMPTLSDEFHYKFLLNYLPKKKIYFKYIKKEKFDNEVINMISDYYDVNQTDALDFYEIMPEYVVEEIKKFYGDAEITKRKK